MPPGEYLAPGSGSPGPSPRFSGQGPERAATLKRMHHERFQTEDSSARLSRGALWAAGLGLLAVGVVAASRVGASEALVGRALPGAVRASPSFWDHWSDGRAELAGYRTERSRYGELRSGTAVYVVVTEPFSYEARVKADPGRHPPSDTFQVLKLNAIEDFQTGIYDYNLMTSVFVPAQAHPRVRVGHPTKLTFSSQEWCGMLFEQLQFEPKRIDQQRFSYFDGEGEEDATLPHPEGGLTVDEMPLFVRGLLDGPPLERGARMERPILPSVARARLLHRPLRWTKGTLERGAEPEDLEVPAGRFEVDRYTLRLDGGETRTYWVETAPPRRLVGWSGPDGEQGELTGVTRLPYWELNQEGHERHLEALGLKPPTR